MIQPQSKSRPSSAGETVVLAELIEGRKTAAGKTLRVPAWAWSPALNNSGDTIAGKTLEGS